jgi:hypothetical protein
VGQPRSLRLLLPVSKRLRGQCVNDVKGSIGRTTAVVYIKRAWLRSRYTSSLVLNFLPLPPPVLGPPARDPDPADGVGVGGGGVVE